MGKLLVAFLLGTALLVLGQVLFGGGLITKFFVVSGYVTSPSHMADLASGNADAQGDVWTIISFIVEIFLYYLAAAVLTFIFDIFMPAKKKEEKKA